MMRLYSKAILYSVVLLQLSLMTTAAISKKKGLGVSRKYYKCKDLDQFKNIHWWYDWGDSDAFHSQGYNCTNPLRTNRVPMKWGWRKKPTSNNPQFRFTGSSDCIMGFNEPNHESQANIRPKKAAKYWKQLEKAALEYGATCLVSPAAAPGGYYDYKKWFKVFFNNCKDCKIDFIATHFYSCNPTHVMNFLGEIWSRYKKKIWLTEFACPKSNNVTQQLEFMRVLLPQLEKAHYVDRYAWFVSRRNKDGYVKSGVSLLDRDESKLSVLGQFYDNFNPT